MASININDKVKITNFGGSYVNGGVTRLFADTVPAVGETYYWDDSGQAREGWTIEVPVGFAVNKIVIYGSQSYPLRAITIEQNGAELAPRGPASTSAPYIFEGNIVGTFQIARYVTADQAMTRIHIFGSASKAIIKSNNQYYSVTDANYNTTTKMYNALGITADLITPTYIDNVGSDVNAMISPVTIGGETFRPLDKFAKFQVITRSSNPTVVSGVKRTKSLIRSKASISFKGMSNIDKITAINTITNSGILKMALMIEGESEWRTTADGGKTWPAIPITIPNAEYSTLTPTQLTQWNAARDQILAIGIPVVNIVNTDFSSFAGKKIFVAFAFNVENSPDKALLTALNIQYDGNPFWRLMKDSESNIDMIDESTVIFTPLITNDRIKVNISNGGTRGLS